jgi:Ceramidase
MDWTRSVFLYCERGTDPGFWAEPFNAVSNAAFLMAAAAAWWEWRRGRQPWPQGLLILGVALVGLGSFLFHTHANAWSSLADIIPIGMLMLGMLVFILRNFLEAPRLVSMAGLTAFIGAMAFAMQVRCGGGECLNGSVGYLPALAGLAIIGAIMGVRRHPAAWYILGAAGVFAVSLVLRTFDRGMCSTIGLADHPIGTHFLWHSLNAAMLYLLLIATVRHGPLRQD